MFSVIFLPRQFQVMVVENVDERHVQRATWVFPLYLLLINLFVLPIALGGLLHFGVGRAEPGDLRAVAAVGATGSTGSRWLAFIGGLSAATGMVDRRGHRGVDHGLQRPGDAAAAAHPALRARLLGRTATVDRAPAAGASAARVIVALLLLGYLYFRVAGEAYALVSIGLISFAAVAQFAPALLAGMYWKGGTRAGALAGLSAGFALWVWTLMLPSIAKSGWMAPTS